MAHLHELIDWTIAAFVVHENKVLFIFHKKLQQWLPLGGHVELDEDPDQALLREVKEESGLINVEVLAQKPRLKDANRTFLYTPSFLDIHPITDNHKHIVLIYFLRSETDKVALAKDEHDEIRWLEEQDLERSELHLSEGIKFYAREALKAARV